MRNLLILRGAPACGKSTVVRSFGLQGETLSLDHFRSLVAPVAAALDGEDSFVCAPRTEKLVVNMFYSALEERMRNGLTTILDATFPEVNSFKRVMRLASDFRYRVAVLNLQTMTVSGGKVDPRMEPLTDEELLRRNATRVDTDFVSPSAVVAIADRVRKADREVAERFNCIPLREVQSFLEGGIVRLESDGKRTVVIGDVQSCGEELETLVNSVVRPDDRVIFTGDLFDRRPDAARVMKVVRELQGTHEVHLIEGNHDTHLADLVHGVAPAHRFKSVGTVDSFEQLMAGGEDYLTLKEFVASFVGAVVLHAGDKVFQFTHAGICRHVDESTSVWELTHGGSEREMLYRGKTSYNRESIRQVKVDGVISVHGHRNGGRNEEAAPTRYDATHYVVEHRVEEGGYLPFMVIEADGTVAEVR